MVFKILQKASCRASGHWFSREFGPKRRSRLAKIVTRAPQSSGLSCKCKVPAPSAPCPQCPEDGADIELNWKMHVDPDRILSLDTEVLGLKAIQINGDALQFSAKQVCPCATPVQTRRNMGSRSQDVLRTSLAARRVLSEAPKIGAQL